MTDPLSEVIELLQPRNVFSKRLSGAGAWGVKYSAFGHPSFCVVLEGSCRLAVEKEQALTLEAGDFVLLPATPAFVQSGFLPVRPMVMTPSLRESPRGEVRYGERGGKPDVRILGGYFEFDSADAQLLVSLLPRQVHVRGDARLRSLVELVADEASERRSGRELVLKRLVEVLLIEALRAAQGTHTPPGLLRALSDERLAPVIRELHRDFARPWSVPELAKVAALSRSAFFARFTRTVGMAPKEYLLGWRMAVARELLRNEANVSVSEVADRVGYGSASSFSTAFSRHVGMPPQRFVASRSVAS